MNGTDALVLWLLFCSEEFVHVFTQLEFPHNDINALDTCHNSSEEPSETFKSCF